MRDYNFGHINYSNSKAKLEKMDARLRDKTELSYAKVGRDVGFFERSFLPMCNPSFAGYVLFITGMGGKS